MSVYVIPKTSSTAVNDITKGIAKREPTEQKVFEVSLQLFAQKGYGNTTIRDIAKAADISIGLLFHYFPSKQALLQAHLSLAAQGMDAAVRILHSGQRPIEIFASIAKLTLTSMHTPTSKYLYVLLNQPLPADTVPEHLHKKINKPYIIAATIPIIKKGQQLGEIKPGSPEALAICFWGSVQGIAEILALHAHMAPPDPELIVTMLRQSRDS